MKQNAVHTGKRMPASKPKDNLKKFLLENLFSHIDKLLMLPLLSLSLSSLYQKMTSSLDLCYD
ncbi:hypothetical protein GmHk_13G037174 [Glycine max]|nr:hypothetical protein GmHk_13G037174 [Glycine max]